MRSSPFAFHLSPHALPHTFVQITIRDTGIGIPANELQRVLSAIETNMGEEEFGVENLAEKVHMSVSQLNRKLNGLIDQPAGQLIRSMRLQRAADLLQQNAGTVAEIAYQVGFGSQAHFTTMFQKQFGCTPSEYRKGQRAEGVEQRA